MREPASHSCDDIKGIRKLLEEKGVQGDIWLRDTWADDVCIAKAYVYRLI